MTNMRSRTPGLQVCLDQRSYEYERVCLRIVYSYLSEWTHMLLIRVYNYIPGTRVGTVSGGRLSGELGMMTVVYSSSPTNPPTELP